MTISDKIFGDIRVAEVPAIKLLLSDIEAEAMQAMTRWPTFNSAHEGFAVLREEVDEPWDHVKTNQKKRDLPAIYKEAVQIAAMALRFAHDVCNEEAIRK